MTDIRGCKDDLGGRDSDAIAGNSACSNAKPGVTSKGFEVEAYLYPARNFTVTTGFTLSDTKYADNLFGTPNSAGDNSLPPALSLLPGGRLSLSSLYSVTGSAQWTPAIGSHLRGLLYGDFRFNSARNTASDLFVEKIQPALMLVNARIGIGSGDQSWSLEGWVQNAFNVTYKQVAFNATLQGSNTSIAQLSPGQTSTQLFSTFLGDPRTFGATLRYKF